MDAYGTESVSMSLPSEVSEREGIKTDNGTVVYNNNRNSVSVGVQAVQEKVKGETYESVRTFIAIDGKDASKRYSLKYDLPSGYKLVTDREYVDKYASKEERKYYNTNGLENNIYILDKNNDIIETISSAWAKDSDGKSVNTYYEIKDNMLIQVIDFDSNAKFPIIAYSSKHAPKWIEEIKKLRNTEKGRRKIITARNKINNRQNSKLSTIIKLFNTIISIFDGGAFSIPIGGVIGNNDAFLEREEDTYTKAYETMSTGEGKKKYKSIKFIYKAKGTWQGKNKGYVYIERNTKYKLIKK